MTTVNETVNLPGAALANATGQVNVSVALYDGANVVKGFHATSGTTIVSPRTVQLDGSAAWSMNLKPNSEITPANTVYRRIIEGPNFAFTDYITVPASGGPYRVDQILTSPPVVVPSSTDLSLIPGTWTPLLRGGTPSRWTRWFFTSDANCPDSALTMEHGQLKVRGVGGTGTQSNRREAWQLPDFPSTSYSRLRSRWASRPPADGTIEHGHMHALQVGSDSKIRAATVWDFGFGNFLCGVWESNPDGSGFVVQQAPVRDSDAFTDGSRTSNVVTLTGFPTGMASRWKVGDYVVVDATDNTYDGTFALTQVNDTSIQFAQTAANDASCGTGTMTLLGKETFSTVSRARTFTDAARVSGVVTSVGLATGHPYQTGDWITVDGTDNTYDGPRFPVTGVNPFTAQISWLQSAADDASAGAGTISKISPFWVETRLLPGGYMQARFWADVGDAYGTGSGREPGGPPPWESQWARTWDLNRVVGATVPTGPGYVGLIAAHFSSNSEVSYDSIEAGRVAET